MIEVSKIMDKVKNGIRTWLNIRDANPRAIVINEVEDLQGTFIKNKIWYRGDANELSQLYNQMEGKETTFWGAVPTTGLEIKKSHSGLPNLIVSVLANIVVDNYNGIECENSILFDCWDKIANDNDFNELLKKMIRETAAIGDGAIKISYKQDISEYPILEWHSGDEIDVIYKRKRLREIVFKSYYKNNNKTYLLKEHYGYGYITYELLDDDKPVSLSTIEELKDLKSITFDKRVMWAQFLKFDESIKFEGRGASKFTGKYDAFDNLDEIISQWIEAIRQGRPISYIPESLCPRDPYTGETLKANPFDNQYIQTNSDMSENSKNEIKTVQNDIPSDKYVQAYITYLGLAIQGIISAATLGIDNKKIQDANASYERQLEKTTLYTRQNIIDALSTFIPKLIVSTINAYHLLKDEEIEEDILEDINVLFGEYDSPSFDSQIDTVSKAKMNGIMSIETSVRELYGDSKDEEWIVQEITRIKEEQGITQMEEPAINNDIDTEDENLE